MAKHKIESIPDASKWGVPDWRDASAYPSVCVERDPTTRHDQYWKWEFLRRDPKYRQDWEKHRKKDHPKLLALSMEDDHEEDFDVVWYPEDHQDLWSEVWRLI